LALLDIPRHSTDLGIIEKALEVFVFIAHLISSVSVLQNFISLLCPIDSKFLPAFHRLTLRTLRSVLSLTDDRREIAVPFTPDHVFSILNLRAEHFASGFTLFFSIFFHENYDISLIRFVDQRQQKLGISLTCNSIGIWSDDLAIEQKWRLPTKQWSYLAISIVPGESTTVYLNEFPPFDLPRVPSQFSPGRLQCLVGGANSDVPEKRATFSAFAMYPLLPAEQIQLFCSWHRPGDLLKKAIFSFCPIERGGYLSLKSLCPEGQIMSENEMPTDLRSLFVGLLVDH
jgi:hypothetical protein